MWVQLIQKVPDLRFLVCFFCFFPGILGLDELDAQVHAGCYDGTEGQCEYVPDNKQHLDALYVAGKFGCDKTGRGGKKLEMGVCIPHPYTMDDDTQQNKNGVVDGILQALVDEKIAGRQQKVVGVEYNKRPDENRAVDEKMHP